MSSSIVPQIQLNKVETQIVDLLNEYTRYFNSTRVSDVQKPLQLRITGGWVRDKLLGRESHDIDIGIDHLSGVDFVTSLQEYIRREKGENTNTSMYKIEKNPEKSKHLETCTTKLFGWSIDFVNLRSEKYADNSRIPEIEVGTPEEDAFRRDATLNSLFYNLTTGQVEDLTGRGLQDLQQGVLRTPLDPVKTFLDDPLRCLRLIRFAATYKFTIEEKTMDAMRSADIKQKLREKISRERINVEFKKIIMGDHPVYGLRLIDDVGFYQLFDCEDDGFETGNQLTRKALSELVEKYPQIETAVKNQSQLGPLLQQVYSSEISKQSLFLNLILYPWGNETVTIKKTTIPVAGRVAQTALRMQVKITDLVGLCCSSLETYKSTFGGWKTASRATVAKTLLIPYKEEWPLMLLTYLAVELLQGSGESAVRDAAEFVQHVEKENLTQAHLIKLLLNGKEVAQLANKKPGPWLSRVNEKLLSWQLDNPSKTKTDMQHNEWSHTVLSVVEQDDHGIWIHRLTGEEFPVLERTNNLLDVGSSTFLESLNLVWGILGQVGLHLLHVALDVGQEGFLVELGLLQSEGVHNVVDGLDTVLNVLTTVLSRRVGTNVNIGTRLHLNHLAVGLVDSSVDFLDVVSVGKQLITRNHVFQGLDVLLHSMRMHWPVVVGSRTNASTWSATSSAEISRPLNKSLFTDWPILVSATKLGISALTRTFLGASSTARFLVSLLSPALDALYTDVPGTVSVASTDETLMMLALGSRVIVRENNLHSTAGESRFTFRMSTTCSDDVDGSSEFCEIPAQLTRMLIFL
ncbi:hypothetical protein OGAPHI_003302 [Ogataea philodendri]|uniref:CCA tRNA nucleotidyltransferase, mitochondrial n=1 Tax=Ogataea philodendri TaxID=1378263 RepID=A0A9P8P788_9ASCO|nr:uncharacterized protein OGAPHI_003302 [Ogataea philodendri]KAH3666853.1 hypothetical protein OGAPHI_003302 [Ogataea philodendri]